MIKRTALPFLLVLLAFFARPVQASHIMGSELTYHWLGGLDYELTLVIVRDCQGISVSDPEMVNLHSVSCALDVTVGLPIVDTAEVANGCSSWLTTCNGGTFPGAQLYFYRDTVTLGGACADWKFTWSNCCRNAVITNLVTPDSYGFSIAATLNNSVVAGNSSPVFQELAGVYVCMGSPYCLPNGTYDADGDSLVYSMVQPIDDSGAPIPYSGGYTVSDPFPSSSGHVFDPVTGNHCSTPSSLGAFVVAYEVQEYRGGVLVGSAHREAQLWVINCPVGIVDINGTVSDTLGNPVTAGDVELYEYGLNSAGSLLVNTTPIGSGGTYAFTGLPAQQYLVRAIPDTLGYPGTANSYHASTYYWTYADVISSTCDSVLVADIALVPTTNLAGTGYLGGYLGDLGIVRSEGPGVPWENVGIILERWPEPELVAFTRSDVTGNYAFNNVPDGTYRIICDHPGLPMLGYYAITVSAGSQSFSDLNYAADASGFFPSGITTSLNEPNAPQIVIAPNPVNQGTAVIAGLSDGEMLVVINDARGRVVHKGIERISGGLLTLDVAQLVPGLYTIALGELPGRVKLLKR